MMLIQALGKGAVNAALKLALASCVLVAIAFVIGRGLATILIETSHRV
jgi:hypothetical protein